mmetsp:Transcript_56673/g.122006  ORF Transcript_56673/g.122006 Transcript_56673/m.122006 type:complete len:309 (-) Transcript_56673:236-1162(-)
MEVANVVPAVVADGISTDEDLVVDIVEGVAPIRTTEFRTEGPIALWPNVILVRGAVEVDRGGRAVRSENPGGHTSTRLPTLIADALISAPWCEPATVARLPLELTRLVLEHVKEDLRILVDLDIQLDSMPEDHQPHGALVVDILVKHNPIVPPEHLEDTFYRAHGKADVRIAVRPSLHHSPTKVHWAQLEPTVDLPGLVRVHLHARIPAAVGGVAVGPWPAVLLAGYEVGRPWEAFVGLNKLGEGSLQEHVVPVGEEHEVIRCNATHTHLILDHLLKHEKLQCRRVAVDEDVARPLAEPDDAKHPTQL